ncbi:heavy metal-responsive transcriptional regulator [Endozoicomonas sp. SM1973]|uniref:Heavy metal-responsive transcriptional regulator n=1 Tax=Spartinivicinus marinus TaxID=2994442 RepID=A0A853IF31_9GAMM|nr:heavy metal-responsive transcriptional regulator [Spartinivicinus marinus]MCX4027112.1 heavy metal-responsive transcriptional regulator [Spartinivicinus marinus]NYZ68591.1 heavy metal-responsive transcriptional regulator [Spartinivicinus marinus]
MERGFTIGQLAKNCNVTVDTIRYYEKQGLLPSPHRRASGYRIYSEADTNRLQFVIRSKKLGFSLKEIKELLNLSHTPGLANQHQQIHAVAKEKIIDIEKRVADLLQIKQALEGLMSDCHSEADTPEHCHLLKAIAFHVSDDE